MSGTYGKDLQLVLRGLQLVGQNRASLSAQRPVFTSRVLTETQRADFHRKKERAEFEREVARQDQEIVAEQLKMLREEEERVKMQVQ